jgi:hypothetical protein
MVVSAWFPESRRVGPPSQDGRSVSLAGLRRGVDRGWFCLLVDRFWFRAASGGSASLGPAHAIPRAWHEGMA